MYSVYGFTAELYDVHKFDYLVILELTIIYPTFNIFSNFLVALLKQKTFLVERVFHQLLRLTVPSVIVQL